jgi:beta-lactamase class A
VRDRRSRSRATTARRLIGRPGPRRARTPLPRAAGRARPRHRYRSDRLAPAALTVSDNTAANLLLDLLGGPAAVTAFVHDLGDATTRFDRAEPDLNVSTGPDDARDTTTPAAVVGTVRAVTLGDGVDPAGRDRLTTWLVANTTGDNTIRAGVPAGWVVGDKTGTGAQGERNDVGIVLAPDRAPLVLAVYTDPDDPDSTAGDATVAEATAIAVRRLGGR